jgi:hypothetical protein
VLGISLGTRKMGLAVLDCSSIFDCCVKSFPGRWSTGKKRAILKVLADYIEIYRITQVSIKLPKLSVEAPTIAELIDEVERLAQAKNINFDKCNLTELKAGVGLNRQANKQELMSAVLEKHSELRQEFGRALKSKVRHYEKLFEAVGVADKGLRLV